MAEAEVAPASPVKTKVESTTEGEVSSPTPLEKKIMRQVEYYFGNNNLWRDKFLKEKIKEDEGWITLECLITFNRLQALTMDFDEIISALEQSKSGLLEIHEDKRKIRRSLANPLPDADDPVVRKAIKMKTLYVKGFPLTYTLDDVQDFILSQDCNNVFVKMRYDDNKKFKGSIFVELSTLEEADKFLTSEMKCGDTVLKIMRREDYFEQKSEERHKKFAGKRKNKDGVDEASGEKKKKDGEEDEESKEPPRLGSVLHFKGCSTDTKREDLKALFGDHEKIEWVDFEIGATQGYIRFEGEGVAQKALDAVKEAAEGKLVIKEAECEGRVIEGIEEKNYWILANEERKRALKKKHDSRNQNKYGKRNNFKKEKNQEWRKRKRAWEYPKEKSEDSENKPKGQHTKFDDEGGEKKDNTEETTEKKLKVEGAAVEA